MAIERAIINKELKGVLLPFLGSLALLFSEITLFADFTVLGWVWDSYGWDCTALLEPIQMLIFFVANSLKLIKQP